MTHKKLFKYLKSMVTIKAKLFDVEAAHFWWFVYEKSEAICR